jgi:hypothetical protein
MILSVKHPYTNDRPTLVEDYNHGGVWTFSVERVAKYRRGGAYTIREFFATVRPVYDNTGFLPHCTGVIVSRNDFGETMHFSNFSDAKLHVRALFALEFAAG